MISRSILLIVPAFLFAQTQPPTGMEQELRARVSGFYQNFVDGTPRKAEVFVAEDTKDWFYSAGKPRYESFKILKVEFDDSFTKAKVNVSQRTEKLIGGQKVMIDVPVETHWKLEDGKWCYTYHQEDYSVTPMGGVNPPVATGEGARSGSAGVKPKDSSPAAVGQAGKEVLDQQRMGLNKELVTFTVNQPGTVEVTFTNGADGEVQIALDGPVVRGVTAKLDKMTIPGHGNAVLSFRYDPTDKSVTPGVWEPKGNITFRVYAQPFNRIYPVNLMFLASK
jgi:hypothetical protein